MSLKKECLPEVLWHPGSQRAGNQQTTSDIDPKRDPVHDKEVAYGCSTLVRSHTLPDGGLMYRHIHGRMSSHAFLKTFLGLLSCCFDDPGCEGYFEEQHHDSNH